MFYFCVFACTPTQLHPGAAGDGGPGPRNRRQLQPGDPFGAPRAAQRLQRRRRLAEAGGARPPRLRERGRAGHDGLEQERAAGGEFFLLFLSTFLSGFFSDL